MCKVLRALIVGSLMFCVPAHAHPGGHGSLDDETAFMIAGDVIKFLSERDAGLEVGRLDPDWLELPKDAKRIHLRGDGYLIISIQNTRLSKTLYVLMSEFGQVLDANYTGVFEGLK